MNRRQFIGTGIAATGLLAGGTWLLQRQANDIGSLQALIVKLESFEKVPPAFTQGWNCAQVFNHMAQSVEFSMQGFPQHKSPLFKASVGKIAFELFKQQGKMHHDLQEDIPGAPPLDAMANDKSAIRRLITALQHFANYPGSLAPHFAFGQLSHQDYSIAHILHIENHLELIA